MTDKTVSVPREKFDVHVERSGDRESTEHITLIPHVDKGEAKPPVSVPVESRQNIAVRGKKWLLWFKQHNGYVPTHIRVPLPDFIEATIEARMHIIGDQPLLVDRLQMMGIPLTPRL